MRLRLNRRIFQWLKRPNAGVGYAIADVTMIAALAWATAYMFWAIVTPLGPVGAWRPNGADGQVDQSVLTRYDPFGRLGGASSGPAVVTSLSVKLFGVRMDGATGRGSAILAGPDGIQQSFAVGDEVVPGARLKAVRIDGVTLDRNGTEEQVFLDQSQAAPTAQPGSSVVQSGIVTGTSKPIFAPSQPGSPALQVAPPPPSPSAMPQ